MHGIGWPLSESGSSGGAFLYHAEDSEVYLGLIADLNYRNPYLSPFEEFQRWKTHPKTREVLEGGERIAYGARALAKGGKNSLPDMAFPGGVLIGCDAGTLNSVKIKGNHTAMKSGMLAAESVMAALQTDGAAPARLEDFSARINDSWLGKELHSSRNFSGFMHKFGTLLGAAMVWIDQNIFRGDFPLPYTTRNPITRASTRRPSPRRLTIPNPITS